MRFDGGKSFTMATPEDNSQKENKTPTEHPCESGWEKVRRGRRDSTTCWRFGGTARQQETRTSDLMEFHFRLCKFISKKWHTISYF